MSVNNTNPTNTSKLVYLLPRIRLSGTAYRQERFTIAKAEFLPDAENSWNDVLQLPRPEWLNIYRQFPHLTSNDKSEPSRGTLIISDDEEWLRKHIARLMAVVFVLGLEESRWQVPADAFQYASFRATLKPHDLVTLYTKSGGKTEDLRSIQLFPPLELRGVSDSFRLDLQSERNVELLRKFETNPYDRLVVACYHLFRSQFENPVIAPSEQDFSAYCACFEAALDVTGPDYAKELSEKLMAVYGKYITMERWIKGLYSERSVFNHGISTEPTHSSTDDRIKALAEFRDRSLNWDVLRKLCLDVILEQLQNSLDAGKLELSRLFSPTRIMLRKFFFSEEIWGEIVKVFTQSKSVEKIRAITGDELDEFIKLCCSYLSGHSWQAMKSKAEAKKVFEVLKAMAAVFGECSKDKNDAEGKTSASQLFNAAQDSDADAVDLWAREHAKWDKEYSASNLEEAVRAVAVHTAMHFSIS